MIVRFYDRQKWGDEAHYRERGPGRGPAGVPTAKTGGARCGISL